MIRSVLAAVLVVLGLAVVPVVVVSAPAGAAPGDPFDPNIPQVFLAQDADGNSRSTLYRAVVQPDGTVNYVTEGPEAAYGYNAIAFNTTDGYIYGTTYAPSPGQIVRIGQGGVVTTIGCSLPVLQSYQEGAFFNGFYWVSNQNGTSMYRVNLATCAITTINFTGLDATQTRPADLTYAYGFFWGIDFTGRMVRISTTGAVTYFAKPSFIPSSSFYGAAWTLGNGNAVFQNNDTGDFYQMSITNAATATPTFTLVKVSNAPQSASNDGTSAPGNPYDLGIVKTGPATYGVGDTVTYSFTVTNNGPGYSSGATVSDTLPAGVTYASSSTSCTAISGKYSCVIPALASGASYTFTMTATVTSGGVGPKTNTATVFANETDTNPANDTSNTTMNGAVSCSTVYGLDWYTPSGGTTGTLWAINTSTAAISPVATINFGSSSNIFNSLAVSKATNSFWYADQTPTGGTTVYRLNAATGATTSFNVTYPFTITSGAFVGAINPADGNYYFGGVSGSTFYVFKFDTTTNTFVGQVAKFTLPAGANNISDIAFDGTGRMYFTADSVAEDQPTRLYVTDAPIPATVNTNFTPVTMIAQTPTNTTSMGSLAFGADGFLYLGSSSGAGTISKVNPSSGQIVSTQTLTGGTQTIADYASCAVPSTISVQKNLPAGRFASGDQFNLSVTGGGLSTGNTGLTAGTETGVQNQSAAEIAGPVIGFGGTTYTITEAAANGANLANYSRSWECVDTLNANAVVASGTGSTGNVVMPTVATGANVVCTFTNTPLNPSISLTKTPDRSTLVAGQVVTYTFTATNTGNTTLSNVQISEGAFNGLGAPMSALTGCSPALGSSLAPGAAMTCTATYTVTQADVDRYAQNGTQLTNAASVVGTPPSGVNVTASANASIPSTSSPAIDLVKTAGAVVDVDGNGADVGDQITYSFSVTNTGNLTLNPVTVADPMLTGQSITISCPAGPLAPGATIACTASAPFTLTQGDVDAGAVSNTATATGMPPSGPAVTDPSSTTTPLAAPSAISLTKTPDRSTLVAGQVVTYTFTATNTGNTTLSNVQISEGAFNGLGAPMSALTGCAPALGSSLAPGASMTCTATYTVTQADVDRYAQDGTALANAAAVVGTPPTGADVTASANASIPSTSSPAIDLVKTAGAVVDVDGNGTDAGDQITFSFSVTNTGNLTLDPVTVADPMLAGQGITISCPAGPLAPGATIECVASGPFTLAQGDIDAGSVTNTATASGTPPSGPDVTDPSSTTTPITPAPGLSLVKDVDATELVAGATLNYTFTATNTGNVTLSDVTISEDSFTGSGAVSPLACTPTQPATLAPGAVLACTATYTVTQADVDAGSVANVASATGTPPGTTTPLPPVTDDAVVRTKPAPGMGLVKRVQSVTDVNENGRVDRGDQIFYAFDVTNTGNVTLNGIAIDDPMLAAAGIAISCPTTTLAPKASTTCVAVAPYVITRADEDRGYVRNVATAIGSDPSGTKLPPVPPSITTTKVPGPDEVSGGEEGGGSPAWLPNTGGPAFLAMLGGAASVLAGLVLLHSGRRRRV